MVVSTIMDSGLVDRNRAMNIVQNMQQAHLFSASPSPDFSTYILVKGDSEASSSRQELPAKLSLKDQKPISQERNNPTKIENAKLSTSPPALSYIQGLR
ncbi:hypothetical protein GOBAR_DD10584 [Gossypium barbadense]|nr:hypothetical protein GOBAR_DD10584 [Gossypium barbadense]